MFFDRSFQSKRANRRDAPVPAVAARSRSVAMQLLLIHSALIFVAIAGCAQFGGENQAPQRVQTLSELMVKLKKGWDERRLDDPLFYERELGYPLERPETLTQLFPIEGRYRRVVFAEGEIKGLSMSVSPLIGRSEHRVLVVGIVGLEFFKEICFTQDALFQLWGRVNPKLPEVWNSEGPPFSWIFEYKGSLSNRALMFVRKTSSCLDELEISQSLN
jgi:hypothetical protein